MMVDVGHRTGPGFQGSEASSAEVFLYTHGDDKVFAPPARGKFSFIGRKITDEAPALISVSTTKTMGATGTFSITIKPPRNLFKTRGGRIFDMRRWVIDDDWIDIVFLRHGDRWHVMRGLIDYVQRVKVAEGNGVTTEAFVLTGRDFGKIFETTEVWFNNFTAENVGGGPSLRAFAASHAIFGDVSKTVHAFLFSFLSKLNDFGRATWELPPDMPNVPRGARFANVVLFNDSQWKNNPERVSYNASWIDVEHGTLWGLAQAWSDPLFSELWVDLVKSDNSLPEPGKPLDEKSTRMAVILRDRPFPTSATGDALSEHSWFRLPTAVVPRQSIVREEVGRGGAERFNAFFAASQIAQEHAHQYVNLSQPLWNPHDIQRHGLRRMDPVTNYIARDGDLLGTTSTQRAKVRDFHVLNPYFYNGQIVLAHGRPDIRVGMRVKIPGESPADDETYYVESVAHTWSFGPGIKTTLGVTRGWVGDDRSLIAALSSQQAEYHEAVAAKPGDDKTEVVALAEIPDPDLSEVAAL